MFCSECQTEIPDNSIICYVCGNKVGGSKDKQKNELEKETIASSNSHRNEGNEPPENPVVKWILIIVAILICLIGIFLSYHYIREYFEDKKLQSQYDGSNFVSKEADPVKGNQEPVENPDVDEQTVDSTTEQETLPEKEIPDTYLAAMAVEGEPMPDFHFVNLMGETVTLDDLLATNKAIYINTFTSWCTYCTREMKDMVTLAYNYRDVLQFVFIDVGEGQDITYQYHIDNGLNVGQVGYVDSWALGGIELEAVPESFVLSKEGIVVKSVLGEQSYGQIDANIVAALLYQ